MENSQISKVKSNKVLKLAPETIRIRDAIVEKYLDVPLDTLSSKLQSLISNETDTGTRLGILSARVEILRMRFADITGGTYTKDKGDSSEENDGDGDEVDAEDLEEEREGWMTLRILEASEVNGVRFPEGVKIDVHTEDAKKLLASKKAELLSMKVEGAPEAEILGEGETLEPENGPEESSKKVKEDSLDKSNDKANEEMDLENSGEEKQSDQSVNTSSQETSKENKAENLIQPDKKDGSKGTMVEENIEKTDELMLSSDNKQPSGSTPDLDGDLGLSPEELADLTQSDKSVEGKPEDSDEDLNESIGLNPEELADLTQSEETSDGSEVKGIPKEK